MLEQKAVLGRPAMIWVRDATGGPARYIGFRGYYLLDGGPDVIITISLFESAAEAFVSNEKAADWVRHNVLEFARGMPEVMVGDVLIAEVK